MIGIYSITNLINNKKYIGQSINIEDRFQCHKRHLNGNNHYNEHLQYAWNKYGEDNFCFDVIQQCSIDELDELERKYIREFNTTNSTYGYNHDDGGHVGRNPNEETRKKMSEAKKGMYDGEKNPMYGVHLKRTKEWKEWASRYFSGKNNPMYGRHLIPTEEQRKKASERMKGKNNPYYGKKHSDEVKKKISDAKTKKRVCCIETQIEYPSINEAQKQTGIHSGSISRSCKKHLTAGGYHWKYVI